MLLFIFLFAGIIASVGLIINEKNASYLLSGYNTLSKEKQAQVDLKGYIKLMRRFHVTLAAVLLLVGLGLYWAGFEEVALMAVVGIALVAYIYFAYKGMAYFPSWYRKTAYFSIGVLVLSVLAVGYLTVGSFEPNRLVISDQSLQIEGLYSYEVPLTAIESVEVVEKLPAISLRTNGVSLGKIQKGHYRTKEKESIRLYKEDNTHPYLQIRVKDSQTIYYQLTSSADQAALAKLQVDYEIQ